MDEHAYTNFVVTTLCSLASRGKIVTLDPPMCTVCPEGAQSSSALCGLAFWPQLPQLLFALLSDEMYEILSSLPESVAYTCTSCTEQHPAEWRLALENELQQSLKQVVAVLLSSRTTSHLLRYRQVSLRSSPARR